MCLVQGTSSGYPRLVGSEKAEAAGEVRAVGPGQPVRRDAELGHE